MSRTSAFQCTARCFSIALVLTSATMGVAGDTITVSGRFIYGSIDEDPERNSGDDGERASIFQRGLAEGEPIAHVRIELGRWIGFVWDSAGDAITNELGQFSIETSSTPNRLRINAENDYVKVKESKDAFPLMTDRTLHVEFNIEDAYEGGDVDLGEIEIDDYDHTFKARGNTWGISRALYICTSIHRGARHIEELTGGDLKEELWVRLGLEPALGIGGTAWYDQFSPLYKYSSLEGWLVLSTRKTIHLPGTDAAIVEHEFGHFLEDMIGAFGVIPSWLTAGGHTQCGQQFYSGTQPNHCWAFLEGLATWYGAVNAYGFPAIPGIWFFGEPPDLDGDGDHWEIGDFGENSSDPSSDTVENDLYDPDDDDVNEPMRSLGDNWWVETGSCFVSSMSSWTDLAAVETIVARILWDLIDSHEDTIDPLGTGIPEVAEIAITDVLDVLMADIPDNTPCGWLTHYTHPVTLEQFCTEYRDRHPGPVPDLYIAYAFNGITTGCVADTEPPSAARIASSTHPAGEWRNTLDVVLDITDGDDDTSGSYYYYESWDASDSTELAGSVGTDDFTEKAEQFTSTQRRMEGDDQYYHLQTRDIAGHLGTTAHFGPVRIDITPPTILSFDVPDLGDRFLIGEFVHVEWEAYDLLSGVDYVVFSYTDEATGSSTTFPERISAASGSHDVYLDPDVFIRTIAGRLTLRVVDRATNEASVASELVTVVSPFEGPFDLGFDVADGRVVSGDLDGDGRDDVVLSGTVGGLRVLRVIQPSTGVSKAVVPGMKGGDLFLADLDGDGDLDLVAGGDFAGSPQIYTFQNDGAGNLTSKGALTIPTFQDMVLRVVDFYGDGEPVLVYGGRKSPAAPSQELIAYRMVSKTRSFITGTYFRGGDFEIGDIDRNGTFDFVTLGSGPSGSGSVRFYRGSTVENEAEWTATQIGDDGLVLGDVDLGNWDDDGDIDFFIMQKSVSGGTEENETQVWEWQGSKFVLLAEADAPHRVAEGDGHIVDIYSDGWSDAFALGRLVSGGALSTWYETSSPLGRRGSGAPVPVRPSGVYKTDTAWGDFDGDKDLDVVVLGSTSGGAANTLWFSCTVADFGRQNRTPSSPINLSSEYDAVAGGYTFKWEAPGVDTDETAESAFQYELRVGTLPGGNDIVTWAHPAAASQQFAPHLATDHFERFVPLALGGYFWSVRTVDSGWLRSEPAPEQQTSAVAPVPCWMIPGDCDHDGVADACEVDTDGDTIIDDCDADDDNDGVLTGVDPSPLDPYICGDADGDGCDDCSNGIDGFGPLVDFDPFDDGPDRDGDGLCDDGDPCPDDNPDDSDLDGVCDSSDRCPGVDDSIDTDGDGNPDACDACPADNPDDSDGDGVCDSSDRCPGFDDAKDADGDGAPNACDPCPHSAPDDSDFDTVCDEVDVCPGGDDKLDTDGDGNPDACDRCPLDNPDDSDFDSACDSFDVCPGHDDFADWDLDSFPDGCDNCPNTFDLSQLDTDGDGVGDACEGLASPPFELRRSDCNGDGITTLSDAVTSLSYLFTGGKTPPCLAACDANGDGTLSISDGIYTLSYLFLGGPAPPDPFPDCGPATASDMALGCVTAACP